MKRARLATSGLQDFVSDSSILFVDEIDCDDAGALKQALVFLKGTLREVMRAKEEELARLREEKEAAVAAKLDLMVEVRILKKQVEDQAEDAIQSKFALMEKVELAEKEKEDANKSRFDLIEKVKFANSETAELKSKLAEVSRKLAQADKEKEAAIESKPDEILSKADDTSNVKKAESYMKKAKLGEKDNEDANKSKFELMVKIKQANSETAKVKSESAEMARKLAQATKEKEESKTFEEILKSKMTSVFEDTRMRLRKIESQIVEIGRNAQSCHNNAITKTSTPNSFVWKRSGSKVCSGKSTPLVLVDALNCAPLTSGIFEWTIRVKHTDCNVCDLRLGVISSSKYVSMGDWIGRTNNTWGYGSKGCASHGNKQKVHNAIPKFTIGSTVRFVLDLNVQGRLHVAVDGSTLVQLFSEMKSSIQKGEGFLPAVSLTNCGAIELLDVRCLSA